MAISRGTLISRKTITPNNPTSTGNSGAADSKDNVERVRNRRAGSSRVQRYRERDAEQDGQADRGDTDDLKIELRLSRFSAYPWHGYYRFAITKGVHLSPPTIVVLEGDQTGQELLVEALRVLDRSVIEVELAFEHYDLSLEKRRETNNQIVLDAAEAMKKHASV